MFDEGLTLNRGALVLVVKPGAAARAALAQGHVISVRVTVSFRSALGGSPTTHVRTVSVRTP